MKEYLGKTFDCSCGKVHSLPIKEVLVEEDALQKVPDIVSKVSDEKIIHLIGDKNTYAVAGDKLINILEEKGYEINKILLEEQPGEDHVIPNPDAMFKILSQITGDGYIIACGSGTINDLTRYISFKLERPYMIVATAPSMDGYASSVSPITVDGVKKTFEAVPPEAIVADLNVLKEAPWAMFQAGLGDLLGKNSSLLDWKLSKILFDEYYCPEAVSLVADELKKIMDKGKSLKQRDLESTRALIKGLIYSGLSMLMIGNSRPASGSEHHISHFLEMYGDQYKKDLPPHGVKVGIGIYFTSSFYLKLKELDFSQVQVSDNKEERIKGIKESYQDKDKPILQNLEERWERELFSKELLLKKEDEIKDLIDRSAEDLKQVQSILRDIGILEREDVKNIDKAWIEKALKFGFEIRARFTVSTLLKKIGYLNKWSEELVEKFVS